MHFSSAIAIAILAALPPVTVGSSVLDARQNAVTCQTSDASPTTEDVTQLIGVINTQPGDCSNKNGKVSDCTTLGRASTAAISICGGKEPHTCQDVANYAYQIQLACVSGDLVGGTYQINAATRVEVINSKSTNPKKVGMQAIHGVSSKED